MMALGTVGSRVARSVGVGRAAPARVLLGLLRLPGKGLAGGTCFVPPLFVVLALALLYSLELRSYPGSPPLPCLVWWCPWLRLPVHSYRGTKSVPFFLYTDRSPRAWATHKRDALLG